MFAEGRLSGFMHLSIIPSDFIWSIIMLPPCIFFSELAWAGMMGAAPPDFACSDIIGQVGSALGALTVDAGAGVAGVVTG